jgi:hypothetical protein
MGLNSLALGTWLAVMIAVKAGRRVKRLTVYTDNQAAILSTVRPLYQSGQMILGMISKSIDILSTPGPNHTPMDPSPHWGEGKRGRRLDS